MEGLMSGVESMLLPSTQRPTGRAEVEPILERAIMARKDRGLLKTGDKVVCVSCIADSGSTINDLRVYEV